MITYNWNCKTVDAYPTYSGETDVVYNVHWIVTAVSDQVDPEGNAYQASAIGTQVLNTGDITDFTPFDQLTNDQVVQWVKGAMGEENVDNLENSLQSQIDNLITPTSVTLTIADNPVVEE